MAEDNGLVDDGIINGFEVEQDADINSLDQQANAEEALRKKKLFAEKKLQAKKDLLAKKENEKSQQLQLQLQQRAANQAVLDAQASDQTFESQAPEFQHLLESAVANVKNLLENSILLSTKARCLVIYDIQCPLTCILAQAYAKVLSEFGLENRHIMLDYDKHPRSKLMDAIDALADGDFLGLVQTDTFRPNEYKVRIPLFQRGGKYIEVARLGLVAHDQYATYINSLGFDPRKEGRVAHELKNILEKSKRTVVECYGGTTLVYETGMEAAKLNIGDYTGMNNVGASYPVGEVFTEPSDLTAINGEMMIWGFPNVEKITEIADHTKYTQIGVAEDGDAPTKDVEVNTDFEQDNVETVNELRRRVQLNQYKYKEFKPFKIAIKQGQVSYIDPSAPQSFAQVFDLVNSAGELFIREFGLGLNAAMGKTCPVNIMTAFERHKGMHVSLGNRHPVYKKPNPEGVKLQHKQTKYHIDLFLDVCKITIDDRVVYQEGEYLV